MKEKFYAAGDYINSEDGTRHLYQLQESATFNEKFYFVRAKELVSEKMCYLKFVKTDAESYKLNNLSREGNFCFTHPNIERVYGNFRGLNPLGEDIYGVAVEYLDGVDLTTYRRMLRNQVKDGSMTEEELDQCVFRQMLQFLHGMNYYSQYASKIYLHRDIKPQNVMITEAGIVKIVDFDFAHIGGSKNTVRLSGWDTGISAGYTSPELFTDDTDKKYPDLLTDIYSVGRTFFFWLNGRHYYSSEQTHMSSNPSTGSAIPETAEYIANEKLRYGFEANEHRFEPRYLEARYEKLREILDRMCCHPRSEERYYAVSEILQDMEDFLLCYCNYSRERYTELFGSEVMGLLLDAGEVGRKSVMCAYKIEGGFRMGKRLYEYSMRDIVVNHRLILTIYNLGNAIYYIPAQGIHVTRKLVESNRDNYRLHNKDVLICDGQEITFFIR